MEKTKDSKLSGLVPDKLIPSPMNPPYLKHLSRHDALMGVLFFE